MGLRAGWFDSQNADGRVVAIKLDCAQCHSKQGVVEYVTEDDAHEPIVSSYPMLQAPAGFFSAAHD